MIVCHVYFRICLPSPSDLLKISCLAENTRPIQSKIDKSEEGIAEMRLSFIHPPHFRDASPNEWPRSYSFRDDIEVIVLRAHHPCGERKGRRCRKSAVRSVGIDICLQISPHPHHIFFSEKIIEDLNLQSATSATRSPTMVRLSTFYAACSFAETI